MENASEGRLIKNFDGVLVVFRDGVAESVSKATADKAEALGGYTISPLIDVNKLYEELGTWTKVAEHLNVTTAQLRKLREI